MLRPGADGPRAPATIHSSSAARPGPGRPESAQPALPDADLLQRLIADWDRLCRQALAQDAALAAALTSCRPARLSDGVLQLELVAGPVPSQLAAGADGLALAERLLRQTGGRELRLQPLSTGASAPSALATGDGRNRAYAAAQQHPVVRELQERFGAEILAQEPSQRQQFLEGLRGDKEVGPPPHQADMGFY